MVNRTIRIRRHSVEATISHTIAIRIEVTARFSPTTDRD